MGLDFLDITFRIERTFAISIESGDFEQLVRDGDIVAGDLYDHILTKMHLRDVGRYDIRLNYLLWTEMRGFLQWAADVPQQQVELKTPLASLFPRETRQTTWQALRDVCPYRIRDLDYPRPVRMAGFSLAAGMVLVEQFHIWQIPGLQWLWPVLGLIGVWTLAETYVKMLAILRPWRTAFPSGMATVKDLCRAVLAANYDQLCRNAQTSLDDRCAVVWQQLTGILADCLGIDADQVTFRSRLIRDLGMA